MKKNRKGEGEGVTKWKVLSTDTKLKIFEKQILLYIDTMLCITEQCARVCFFSSSHFLSKIEIPFL